jgi:hypothetical protein
VVLLDEVEERGEDNKFGSSTKQGGWWWWCKFCLAGDDATDAVALRISFSVCVRCSSSLSRSLSDCSEVVVLVSWWSLASRSRTWRSLRSRKARCLWEISALLFRKRRNCRMDLTYAALFWAFRRDCAGVNSSLSTLFDLRSSCPRRAVSPSRSRIIPLSMELSPPLDSRVEEEIELELSCLMVGLLLDLVPLLPFDLIGPSKLYSKTAGMAAKLLKLASKFCSSSML